MVKNPSNSKRGIETASTTLVEAATAENQPTFDSPATSLKSLLTSIHKDDPRWLSISRYIFDIAGGMQDIAVVALSTSKQPTDEMEVTKNAITDHGRNNVKEKTNKSAAAGGRSKGEKSSKKDKEHKE